MPRVHAAPVDLSRRLHKRREKSVRGLRGRAVCGGADGGLLFRILPAAPIAVSAAALIIFLAAFRIPFPTASSPYPTDDTARPFQFGVCSFVTEARDRQRNEN